MLASISRAQMGPSYIANLKGADGVLVYDSKDDMHIMWDFYENLYSSRLAVTPMQVAAYLQDKPLSVPSDVQREYLEAPVQLEELRSPLWPIINHLE